MVAIKNVDEDVKRMIGDALSQLQTIVNEDAEQNLLFLVELFLREIISGAIEVVEKEEQGSAPYLYAEIEAFSKAGGIKSIENIRNKNGTVCYSVSGIEPNDAPMAMNYLGQELAATLFKGIHELPYELRTPEMLLRGIEALLANVLSQKFDNPHDVLDSFSEHVHLALDDVVPRTH